MFLDYFNLYLAVLSHTTYFYTLSILENRFESLLWSKLSYEPREMFPVSRQLNIFSQMHLFVLLLAAKMHLVISNMRPIDRIFSKLLAWSSLDMPQRYLVIE